MTLCCFVGPTISPKDAGAVCPALYWPPVRQGDIYRVVTCHRPSAIGIVDGLFDGVPSVWHKEILWAMAEGVVVFGSASMGALRAAELHRFGMRGVGRVFEAYRDGHLTDDDEVALAHAPAELDYAPLSEPMVNIRETLAHAVASGVAASAVTQALERIAKRLHFPDRQWARLLAEARDLEPDCGDLDALADWLPEGRIDVKRLDALAMLGAMAELPPEPGPAKAFQPTSFWRQLTARIDAEMSIPEEDRWVLDELKLEGGECWRRIREAALLRWVCDRGRRGPDEPVAGTDIASAVRALRTELGLYNQAAFETWCASNGLDQAGVEQLAVASARRKLLFDEAALSLDQPMLDEMRLSGDYARLAARSEDKRARLAARGLLSKAQPPASERLALRLWFIRTRIGASADGDPLTAIRRLGFADVACFDRALQRERDYLNLIGGPNLK